MTQPVPISHALEDLGDRIIEGLSMSLDLEEGDESCPYITITEVIAMAADDQRIANALQHQLLQSIAMDTARQADALEALVNVFRKAFSLEAVDGLARVAAAAEDV